MARRPAWRPFKKNFGLGDHEVDPAYVFIPMGKDSFLTVITRDAAERVQAEKHPDLVGIFSNGAVHAFDPNQGQDKKGGFKNSGGFGTFGPPKM